MENKKMKFKVGDNVKVVKKGYSYTGYDHMFRKLNFRNTDRNPCAPEGIIATVFGVCAHTSSNSDVCVAIRDKFGTEYLIEQRGLTLVEDKVVGTTTTKVTRNQLGDIYPLVCENWKDRITQVLSQNPFSDTMAVDNELLLKAYSHANNVYHTSWLDEVTGGINSLKPHVEVGKWYNVYFNDEIDNGGYIGIIKVTSLEGERVHFYGLEAEDDGSFKWIDKDWYRKSLSYQESTDTEVFEALKKEAIRRGLIEGVKIKSPFLVSDCESLSRLSNSYELRENSFFNLGHWDYTLMKDGIWATPIEIEPKYIWLMTERKGKIVIQQHPEKQLVNLISNGWEVVIESDLERIKKELI